MHIENWKWKKEKCLFPSLLNSEINCWILTLGTECLKYVHIKLFFKAMCKKYVGNNDVNVYMHILRTELEFSKSDIGWLKMVLFNFFIL